MHFGEHFMLDGYRGSYDRLNSKDLVLRALIALPKRLKMATLGPPRVYHSPARRLKDPGGWTGFVVIAESHISIHTFPKRGFFTADVYTCQTDLNIQGIKEYFRKQFKLQHMETHFIKRGLRYPDKNIYE